MDLILASGSPRRREILSDLGASFRVLTCDTDESTDERDGERYAMQIALRKGEAVRDLLEREGGLTGDTVIVACDTVVVSPDGEIMGKPKDREDARRMLLSLSGRSHRVISGVAIISRSRSEVVSESTAVHLDAIESADLKAYLDTDEPYDKAGAYAIQGHASLWIRGIEGDYFNVVGLPVKRLSDTLREHFGERLI